MLSYQPSRRVEVDNFTNCRKNQKNMNVFLHTSAKTPLDGLDILRRICIALGFDTTLAIFTVCVTRKVIHRKALGRSPHDLTFNAQTILASLDSKVAKFTPILTCNKIKFY